MSKDLAKLFARRFIQRPDVKAVQLAKAGGGLGVGDWFPDTRIDASRRPNSPHLPAGFNMDHLLAHLSGDRTYGHYLLDKEGQCKMFAFDIDLEKKGSYVTIPDWTKMPEGADEENWLRENTVVEVVEDADMTLRDLWQSRKKSARPARNWFKYQMKHLASTLAARVEEMGIPCAVAYSGSKGVHVYGMTGTLPAHEVREAAMIAMDMTGEFMPKRGKNFFMHKNDDPFHGFQNFSIEVFPKQETLDGKNFGNLIRLPLGVNHKNAQDPTFFLDMTTPMSVFQPHPDPVRLLQEGKCFE